jgi:hypothetical protein
VGVWGIGLYSGDFARDLRAAVAAVARLPFDPDKLADILCTSEPSAANDPVCEDHTTFWLVVADRFAKIGIDCVRARNKALSIIDGGDDIAALELLGMTAPDLRGRERSRLDRGRLACGGCIERGHEADEERGAPANGTSGHAGPYTSSVPGLRISEPD